MKTILTTPWLTSLSSLFINLSAAWFATIFVLPSLSTKPIPIPLLILNVTYGIVCLLLAVELEKHIVYE